MQWYPVNKHNHYAIGTAFSRLMTRTSELYQSCIGSLLICGWGCGSTLEIVALVPRSIVTLIVNLFNLILND